jgi:hypothetical protein
MCINSKAATNGSTVTVGTMKVYALTKAKYLTTTVVSGGTEITLVTWGMTLVLDCSLTPPVANATACGIGATGLGYTNSVVNYGWSNYQPKETSDKVYAGIPRFSKGDLLVYKGLVTASGFPAATCGTGKALTGASALVAGAAIAFGAAALAF